MKSSKPVLPLSVLVIDSDRAVRERIAALEGLDVIAVDPSVEPLPDEGYAWCDVVFSFWLISLRCRKMGSAVGYRTLGGEKISRQPCW